MVPLHYLMSSQIANFHEAELKAADDCVLSSETHFPGVSI